MFRLGELSVVMCPTPIKLIHLFNLLKPLIYYADSITHLIFKNGSPATLKKAMSKNVFIINLLWISKCKREGKRLPEKDFIIERPQGLVIAGKKRRKSMEPGKVRALTSGDLEASSKCG